MLTQVYLGDIYLDLKFNKGNEISFPIFFKLKMIKKKFSYLELATWNLPDTKEFKRNFYLKKNLGHGYLILFSA